MACPLPEAKRVVMAAEYKRILELCALAPGEKNRIPGWLQRLSNKTIRGEWTVRWALRLHHSLLKYARQLGVGPAYTTGPSKKKPTYYYRPADVIAWCAENRVRFDAPAERPGYLVREYLR